jgi:hypothetical protein
MSNLELIDDYLTNRLNEQDRKSFEKQMDSDPALKADVELQKEIIQGLKAARAAELKAMLNNVPVGTFAFKLSPLQIASGILGAAIIATSVYFYLNTTDNITPATEISPVTDSINQQEQNSPELKPDKDTTPLVNEIDNHPKPAGAEENTSQLGKQETNGVDSNTKQESKPVIDLVDPTEELNENDPSPSPVKSGANNSTISVAKINVDINTSERKYKSHYQFTNGKLVLYGNFNNGLYEIIEVNAQQSRSLFLYYKASYFLLDETQREITPLKEISDPVLKEKLKAFRSH